MVDRIRAAKDSITKRWMARTIFSKEGITLLLIDLSFIEREQINLPRAVTKLEDYHEISKKNAPILANITDLDLPQCLDYEGCKMILYPLSAFRAMSKAAEDIYRELINSDNQKKINLR